MTNRAVIGLGFGDEGKGCVTEYLCAQDPENTLVVRFSGGQQAAHTVFKDDKKHIFSHFGSGTLSGCPTYWSEYCTFNPWTWWKEYWVLHSKGIVPRFYVHPFCAVTTFYDMWPDKDSPEMQHGTCGHGIFRTKQRFSKIPFTVYDLLMNEPEWLDHKIKEIQDYYGVDPLDPDGKYWDAVFNIRTLLHSNVYMIDRPPYAKNLVFEGSQGLMLDEHIGHMPHCTPSDVTPRNAMKFADLDEIFLITRCYQTRHGNGPMTNAEYQVHLVSNDDETCLFNQYQGEFRTTILDVDQLIHAKREGIDKIVPPPTKISLVVTCMDQMHVYKCTRSGELQTMCTPSHFVEYLADALNINGDIYQNWSPRSNLLAINRQI